MSLIKRGSMKKNKKNKPQRWDAVLSKLPKKGEILGAEIGVCKGDLSKKLLEARPGLKLYLVDRWTAYSAAEKATAGNTPMTLRSAEWFKISFALMKENLHRVRERYIILNGDSKEMANQVEDESLDFVFIDADHSYEGCMADIVAWAPKVKTGGLISGHDYGSKDHPGVKKAVDEVYKKIETGPGHTWFVKKEK